MKAVYLGEPDKELRRFICGIKEDDKATVTVDNDVVAKDAFKSVVSVENIHFEKCKCIEESAFENCADLKNVIWMEKTEENPKAYDFSGSVKKDEPNSENGTFNVTITEKVAKGKVVNTDSIFGINIPTVSDLEIQRGAFKSCSNLQTVIFPKSKKITIEKDAFGGCQNLRTIVFPYENKQVVDISGDAFVGCSKVTFVCSKASAACRYAREHGFEIVNY